VLCGVLVEICSSCDRGNRYCFDGCAAVARAESRRRSSARYQATEAGRLNHAARQQTYLERREEKESKVTHQGFSGGVAVIHLAPTS
jgi:hypothetical protein